MDTKDVGLSFSMSDARGPASRGGRRGGASEALVFVSVQRGGKTMTRGKCILSFSFHERVPRELTGWRIGDRLGWSYNSGIVSVFRDKAGTQLLSPSSHRGGRLVTRVTILQSYAKYFERKRATQVIATPGSINFQLVDLPSDMA
jgi:hypothetical protein